MGKLIERDGKHVFVGGFSTKNPEDMNQLRELKKVQAEKMGLERPQLVRILGDKDKKVVKSIPTKKEVSKKKVAPKSKKGGFKKAIKKVFGGK